MPRGIATEIVGEDAYVSFLDPAQRGPALGRLLALGVRPRVDTAARRPTYRVSEAAAAAAGLIDVPKAPPVRPPLVAPKTPEKPVMTVDIPAAPKKAASARKTSPAKRSLSVKKEANDNGGADEVHQETPQTQDQRSSVDARQ
jgi:hypothetical protein